MECRVFASLICCLLDWMDCGLCRPVWELKALQLVIYIIVQTNQVLLLQSASSHLFAMIGRDLQAGVQLTIPMYLVFSVRYLVQIVKGEGYIYISDLPNVIPIYIPCSTTILTNHLPDWISLILVFSWILILTFWHRSLQMDDSIIHMASS